MRRGAFHSKNPVHFVKISGKNPEKSMKSSKSKKSLKNHRNPSKIHRNPSKIHRNPLKIRKSTKNIGSTWCNLFVKVLCHVKNGGQRKKSRKKIRKIRTNPENPNKSGKSNRFSLQKSAKNPGKIH